MEIRESTKLHRKSGVWGTRLLWLFDRPSTGAFLSWAMERERVVWTGFCGWAGVEGLLIDSTPRGDLWSLPDLNCRAKP